MTTKKKILLSCLLAFAALGFTPFLFDQIVARHYLNALKETKINPGMEAASLHYPEFKKDVVILAPILEFMNGPKLRDAGPYLNPRSVWESTIEIQKQIQAYEAPFGLIEKFDMPPSAKSELKKIDGSFLKLDPRAFTDIDTQWLRKLHDFDHWDIDKNSPVDLFPRFSFSTPIPNFHLAFTKVHLLKAQTKNDAQYLQAVRDVIHYGELALTTETLVGEMIFVATLNQAEVALNVRPQLRKQLGPWTAVIKERERLKRVYWAVNQYARPSLQIPSRVWKQTYLDNMPAMGLCASVRESTAMDWPTWSAMTDVMAKDYLAYRQVISQNPQGCRLTWIKEKTPAWVKLPEEANSLYSSEDIFGNFSVSNEDSVESTILTFVRPMVRIVEWMPQTRQLVGTLMASISVPNYTNLYEKKPAAEKSLRRKVSSEKVATGQVKE